MPGHNRFTRLARGPFVESLSVACLPVDGRCEWGGGTSTEQESGLRPAPHSGPTCFPSTADILLVDLVLLTSASGGEREQGKGTARGIPSLLKSENERRQIQKQLSTCHFLLQSKNQEE